MVRSRCRTISTTGRRRTPCATTPAGRRRSGFTRRTAARAVRKATRPLPSPSGQCGAVMADPSRLAADITVVIPTVGRPLLRDCLHSVAAGLVWPGELIVVDQSCGDDVAAWVAALRAEGLAARHLPSAETGIANATNRGLEQACTRFVAVTHDDCRVDPSWLTTLLARLHENGE